MKKTAGFILNPYPYRYIAKYEEEGWSERVEELPHDTPEKEMQLSEAERYKAILARNDAHGFPLINYTTQYANGCFEGLKCYPQQDGSLALFRVEQNAKRFYNSMKGLYMPPFPEKLFVQAILDLMKQLYNENLYPQYNPAWEKDNFLTAKTIYIRPFSFSEGGIGVSISKNPWVIIATTSIGSYFAIEDCPGLMVTDRVRATPHGTGWIKSASNYLIPALAKKEAVDKGHIEALFLDSQQHTFVEECSSCNIFFVLQNDVVVTPDLRDTILPGITRDSIITLLRHKGFTVEERPISIDEVMSSAKECFATGTAVGINHFGKLTYKDTTKVFDNDGNIGDITQDLLITLKHLQHGKIEDTFNWMTYI